MRSPYIEKFYTAIRQWQKDFWSKLSLDVRNEQCRDAPVKDLHLVARYKDCASMSAVLAVDRSLFGSHRNPRLAPGLVTRYKEYTQTLLPDDRTQADILLWDVDDEFGLVYYDVFLQWKEKNPAEAEIFCEEAKQTEDGLLDIGPSSFTMRIRSTRNSTVGRSSSWCSVM